jgi:hypothetical protein
VESSESAEAVGDVERGRLLTGCGGGGGSEILGTLGIGSVILGGGGGSVILIGGVVCREDGFAALGDRRITVVVLVFDSACIGGARGDGFFGAGGWNCSCTSVFFLSKTGDAGLDLFSLVGEGGAVLVVAVAGGCILEAAEGEVLLVMSEGLCGGFWTASGGDWGGVDAITMSPRG